MQNRYQDDYILVHLDNDVTNNSVENIRAISRSVNARMTANKFWSKDPNITKAGILCCELDELLKEESYDRLGSKNNRTGVGLY